MSQISPLFLCPQSAVYQPFEVCQRVAAIYLLPANPCLRSAIGLAKYRRQFRRAQAILLFQLVAVQELHRHPEPGDEIFPFIAHAEGGVRDGAKITSVGLRRNDLVADVEQRVHETAVGVVDEDEGGFFHLAVTLFRLTPQTQSLVRRGNSVLKH